jgi:DNA-binding protein Fis
MPNRTARVVPRLRARKPPPFARAAIAANGLTCAEPTNTIASVSLYLLLTEAAESAEATTLARDPEATSTRSLEDVVLARLREYASNLQGHSAQDMYGLIMPQLERPLLRVAMELAKGRQRHAAAMLGIHRNTLRTRLKELGLESNLGKNRKLRRGR